MQVKDVIKLACEMTDNNDLIDAIDNNNLTDDEQVTIDCLVGCFNLINNEVASEYIPLLHKETMKTQDFKINFDDFSKKMLEIISIKDKLGRNVKYKRFDSYIMTKANEVEIIYSYLPEDVGINNEISSLLPERVYAYGIAREYLFMQSMFDDAQLWDSRFKNSLRVLTRKKGEIKMPKRSFL